MSRRWYICSNGKGTKEEYKYPQNVVQYVQTEYTRYPQILRLIALIMTAIPSLLVLSGIRDFPNAILTLLKLSLALVCAYCCVGVFQWSLTNQGDTSK